MGLTRSHLAEREVTPSECMRPTGFLDLSPALWAAHSGQYQFHRFLRGRKLAKSAGGGITEKSRGRNASPRPPARRPILGVQRGWTCRREDAPFLRLREWRRRAWGDMRVILGRGVRAPDWNAWVSGCATAGSARASVGKHGSGSALMFVMHAGGQRGGAADAQGMLQRAYVCYARWRAAR